MSALSEARAEFRVRHGLPNPGPADREAAFQAMRPSRFRRERQELGGRADTHLSTSHDYWKMREIAWAMDRDDILPGRWVDRALDNVLPLSVDPQTDDAALDEEFRWRWEQWAEDPQACDVAQRLTWDQIERLILRTTWMAGDCPVILNYDLHALQVSEPERLASPDTEANIVHGVEVDPKTERRIRYHFLRQVIPWSRWQRGHPTIPALGDERYISIDAQDETGRPNVLLVHDPKRVSETRGVTIWHGAFDVLGMIDDTLFAELQKQQTASCIPVFITSERDVRLANRVDAAESSDGETDTEEELKPGTVPRLRKGEKIEGIANSGSHPDFEVFLRYQLRFIALQLGLPYCILMYDTTNTTFHGYRGEFEQAKLTIRRLWRWYPSQLHKRVWQHLLVPWWAEDIERAGGRLARAVAKARTRGTLLRVRVQGEAPPYVEPLKDAQADDLKVTRGLTSRRRLAADHGIDLVDLQREQVEDRASEIRTAAAEAEKLAAELGEPITWRDLLPGAVPAPAPAEEPEVEDEDEDEAEDEEAEPAGKPEPKPAKKDEE